MNFVKDAARQCDIERERYIELQRQVEIKKREIIDMERNIRSKESDLESAISAADSTKVCHNNY